MKTKQVKNAICSLGLLIGLLGFFMMACFTQSALAIGKEERKQALLATVRLAAPIDGQQDEQSTGSGVIITADGHILTSYSVIGDAETATLYNSEGLVYVAITPPDLKGLPTWTYRAAVVQGDPKLGVAVLRINGPFNGSGVLPENLGLVPITLGDSDNLGIGDEVTIAGYAKAASASVGFASGSITGFLDTDGDSAVDAFSTDAAVDSGRIGGAVVDEAGALIGVPCLAADGTNFIRQLNMADSLIKVATASVSVEDAAATAGAAVPSGPAPELQISAGEGAAVEAETTSPAISASAEITATTEISGTEGVTATSEVTSTAQSPGTEGATSTTEITTTVELTATETVTETISPAEEVTRTDTLSPTTASGAVPEGPRITELVFSDSVDRRSSPGWTTDRFEQGVSVVYAVFRYEGFTDGLDFRIDWYKNGVSTGGDEHYAWDGGASGRSFASFTGYPVISAAEFSVTLSLDGVELATGSFSVVEPEKPSLSGLTFAEGVTADGQAINTHQGSEPFQAGIAEVYAFYDYSGMRDGMKVKREWVLDGEVAARVEEQWTDGVQGKRWVFVTGNPVLPSGDYGLRLYVEDSLALEGEFVVGAEEKPYIGPITFAEGVTDSNQPIRPHGPGEPFAAGTKAIVAAFDYAGMANGMEWSHHWYINGAEVAAEGADDIWDSGPSGADWVRVSASGQLPSGHYRLELYAGDELLSSAETDVAGAGVPVETGVTIAGWLLDYDTDLPIPGAEIAALKPGVRAQTFLRNPREEMILAYGQADDYGYFVMDAPLERGVTYSFVGVADGYQDIKDDDVYIAEDSDSYEEWEIYFRRR
jgi:S1-C subfamily serine protease